MCISAYEYEIINVGRKKDVLTATVPDHELKLKSSANKMGIPALNAGAELRWLKTA